MPGHRGRAGPAGSNLALPGYVPFAELFPTVARFAGLERATAGEAVNGWVLQRLGQPPFPLDVTPQQAGLRDGELIYLSPRIAQLPELAFDDVADVIAVGIGDRPDRRSPADTRRVTFGAAAAALLAGAVVLLLSGPPWTTPRWPPGWPPSCCSAARRPRPGPRAARARPRCSAGRRCPTRCWPGCSARPARCR